MTRLDNEPEKLVQLSSLDPVDGAELLVRHAPRKLLLSEMGVAEHFNPRQALSSLALQPTVCELNGHPRAITNFAPYLAKEHPKSGSRMKLDALQSQASAVFESAVRPRHLAVGREEDRPTFQRAKLAAEQAALGDRRCVGLWARLSESTSCMDFTPAAEVGWQELTDGLSGQLNTVRRSTLPPRELSQGDLAFLRTRFGFAIPFDATSREAWGSGRVTPTHFAAMCQWWVPVLDTVARLNDDWRRINQVRRIHGMVDRVTAENLLIHRPLGTFLLRFSESQAGLLVISFVSTADAGTSPHDEPELTEVKEVETRLVHHCLVTAEDDGCVIFFEGGVWRKYATLSDLILDCKRLVFVEPDVPKTAVFEASAGSRGGAGW